MYGGLHEQFDFDELVFMDIRHGPFSTGKRRGKPEIIEIDPDKLGCITKIPWPDNTFSMVLFDPPHDKWGKSSFMRVLYGSWNNEMFVHKVGPANQEFYRVLKPGGFLFVKIQDNKQRDKQLVELLSNFKLLLKIHQAPLSGRTKNKTYWMLFVRRKTILPRIKVENVVDESIKSESTVEIWQGENKK